MDINGMGLSSDCAEGETSSPLHTAQPPLYMELTAVPVMAYDAYGNSSLYYMPSSTLLAGYQNYATTTGNPAVAAAQAAAARFPGQPALAAPATVPGPSGYHTTTAPLPGNVSVSPSAGATSSPGSTAQLPAGGHYTSPQQATTNPYRGPSPGFKSHQYQSFQCASSPPNRGYKRKSDDSASDSSDSKLDGSSRHSINGQNEHYKLYCKVCRVTLNAPAQAKQHYEGKSHAKRAKLHDDGDDDKKTTEAASSSSSTSQNDASSSPSLKPTIKQESNPSSSSDTTCTTSNSTSTSGSTTSTSTDTSSTSNSTSTTSSTSTSTTATSTSSTTVSTADIHPDVYCKTCGVSFNSTKQAHQHYEGKNHKKKLRASLKASRYDKKTALAGAKYSCNVCRKVMTSQEQLNVHLKGAWHAMEVKTMEKSTAKALRGAWATWTHPKHSDSSESALELFSSQFPNLSESERCNTPGGSGLSGGGGGWGGGGVGRKKGRDFSNYRTPSGKYYCSCCNVTVNSQPQFAQHFDSKKHKAANALKRCSEQHGE